MGTPPLLARLEHLSLNWCKLSDGSLAALLALCPALNTLELRALKLPRFPQPLAHAGLRRLAVHRAESYRGPILLDTPALQELRLSEVSSVTMAGCGGHRLRTLEVQNQWGELALELGELCDLTHLEVRGENIGRALLDGLLAPSIQLRSLVLSLRGGGSPCISWLWSLRLGQYWRNLQRVHFLSLGWDDADYPPLPRLFKRDEPSQQPRSLLPALRHAKLTLLKTKEETLLSTLSALQECAPQLRKVEVELQRRGSELSTAEECGVWHWVQAFMAWQRQNPLIEVHMSYL
eukprot:SM000173S03017  [mRNA]  locus=s173:251321:252579:+ [translate_table: standard]